jgi:hypothetical protein
MPNDEGEPDRMESEYGSPIKTIAAETNVGAITLQRSATDARGTSCSSLQSRIYPLFLMSAQGLASAPWIAQTTISVLK